MTATVAGSSATSARPRLPCFRPVRAWIQKSVDRRFFRSRYDAARTIKAFGASLRADVGPHALSPDLQVVVSETTRPAHVSLWMRAEASP